MIAVKEMRRNVGRFASIVATLGLLAFLLTVLTGLSDGLYYGSTGAVRVTSANAYAFNSEAEKSLIRSTLPPSVVADYRKQPGVEQASGISVILTAADIPNGNSETVLSDVAVFGIGAEQVGYPTDLAQGRLPEVGQSEVLADRRLGGITVGDTVTVGGVPLSVVGLADNVSYQLQPTLWTSLDEAKIIRDAARPELAGSDLVNIVGLKLDDPSTTLAPVEGTVVATSEQTGLSIPGVEQQRSTLNAIIFTTVIVAAIVVVLFFILLVLEKRSLFAVLKAIGTRNSQLVAGVVLQAGLVAVAAVVVGLLLGFGVSAILPSTVPLDLRVGSLAGVAVLLVAAACLGSLVSVRRIIKIDPATALGV
jgi:putative ABC transport system permease protein